jgi:hypothetical protein
MTSLMAANRIDIHWLFIGPLAEFFGQRSLPISKIPFEEFNDQQIAEDFIKHQTLRRMP